jgi:hypothetical protein
MIRTAHSRELEEALSLLAEVAYRALVKESS